MRKDQEILEELQKKPYMVNKYQRPGIYTISLLFEDREILVYIGKSTDMLKRISAHIANIDIDKSNKYRVLRQAKNRGITIQFDTTYYSSAIGEQNIKDDIGLEEAKQIRQFTPPLNYQIPHLDNYHSFDTNKKAKTITLPEILGEKCFVF